MAMHAMTGNFDSGPLVQHVSQVAHVVFHHAQAPLVILALHWHQQDEASAEG